MLSIRPVICICFKGIRFNRFIIFEPSKFLVIYQLLIPELPRMTSDNSIVANLFKTHYSWLCLRASRIIECRDQGQDVASETFLRLIRLGDLSAIREPKAFLSTVAKRIIIDRWRREDLEKAYFEHLSAIPDNTIPDPEDHAIMLETLIIMDRKLARLSAKAKAAFVLSQFAGLTYQQIAERLGVSRARVHQYMQQAFLFCSETEGNYD